MKRVLLLLSLAIVSGSVLINSSASISADNIYDNNYLSASSHDGSDKIQIFPNPVIDKILNITAENSIVKIEILDIAGSSVFIQKYEKETKKVVLNLDNLYRGLYIIKVKLDNNSIFTEKIMIE